MKIDLIAGLSKPKTVLTELPTLKNPDLQEGALPDFAALLNSTIPNEADSPKTTISLEGPVKPVVDIPQEPVPKLTAAPEQEAIVGRDAEAKTLPEKPLDPKTTIATAAPEFSLAPLQMKAESRQLRPAPEASAIHRIATPEQTEKGAEITSAIRAQADVHIAPGPRQKRELPAVVPALVAAKPQPEPIAPAAVFSPLAIDKSADPQREVRLGQTQPDMLALTTKASPQSGMQITASPAPSLKFANVETVVDTSDETQFGIRIERHALEVTGVSRAASQANPVASQITTHLPQLLTKAEKQTVELRLDPPELGRVTIHLTTHDQHVTATVIAERVDTVDLMRRHAELLTATLARAGFSQADLSFQQGQGQNGKAEFEQFQSISGLPESDEPTAPAPTLTGQDGRLDIRL